MDALVAVHNLLTEVLDLTLVHAQDLVVTLLVGPFKRLELLLHCKEVAREFFVVDHELCVLTGLFLIELEVFATSIHEGVVLFTSLDA